MVGKKKFEPTIVDPFSLPEPKFTPESIRKIFDDVKEKQKLAEKKAREEKLGPKGTCQVCEGLVYPKYVQHFDGRWGGLRIGGTSSNQLREILETYYCKTCGLKYEFPPNVEKLKKEVAD